MELRFLCTRQTFLPGSKCKSIVRPGIGIGIGL